MKVLIIDSNGFPPDPDRWPKELRDLYEEAGLVLYTFAPFSTYTMKKPGLVKQVLDVRERGRGQFQVATCSGSELVTESQRIVDEQGWRVLS